MTHEEKKKLWERYPEAWALFEKYNGILQEDQGAWERFVEEAGEIRKKYHAEVYRILQETAGELEKISRRKRDG